MGLRGLSCLGRHFRPNSPLAKTPDRQVRLVWTALLPVTTFDSKGDEPPPSLHCPDAQARDGAGGAGRGDDVFTSRDSWGKTEEQEMRRRFYRREGLAARR